MAHSAIQQHLDRIEAQGYTVLERVIAPDVADELLDVLDRLVRERSVEPAANDFEGRRTFRVYNLLALGRIWEWIPVHPETLPIAEGVLDKGLLISSLSSIDIRPGEEAQPIHADDQLIPIAKPHRPLICNTMWALTDFTEANGATRVVPGSHRWDHSPEYGKHHDSIAAEMPKGSVLIWDGALWHGGGANRTDERRVGIAMNYCAGFLRQQENQQLGIPREVASLFQKRLKRLVGYGIYSGLIGHVDKTDPIEQLGDSVESRVVWDRT